MDHRLVESNGNRGLCECNGIAWFSKEERAWVCVTVDEWIQPPIFDKKGEVWGVEPPR